VPRTSKQEVVERFFEIIKKAKVATLESSNNESKKSVKKKSKKALKK
jgi:hypothetical protein